MEQLCLCQQELSKHTHVCGHAHQSTHTRTPSPLAPAPELICEPLPARLTHIHVEDKRKGRASEKRCPYWFFTLKKKNCFASFRGEDGGTDLAAEAGGQLQACFRLLSVDQTKQQP